MFENVVNNYYPRIEHLVGETIDLLEGVSAKDHQGNNVVVTIKDDGGFKFDEVGLYTITFEAKDDLENKALAYLEVYVYEKNTIKYDALIINGNKSTYSFNNENALKYTSSGTQFRSFDQLQIMTKEFFIESYNLQKEDPGHAGNGKVPYFPNGIIVLIDNNKKVKHVRIATALVEVDENNNVKTTNLDWTNTVDKENGGGNFKNIIPTMENLLPDGGYIMFAPPKDPQVSKKFLVQNIFDTNYTGGAVVANNHNVDFKDLDIEIIPDYEEELSDDEYANENKNTVIVKDKYLDGIPVTTYYYNDGNKKPVIYFFHGFASNRKTGIADRGEKLANLGYYVVSFDAYLHGERMPAFFNDLTYADKQKEIVNIQIQTALDAMNLYHKFFKNDKYVKANEVYSFGVSMGAGSAILLGGMMPEVNGVVSLLGSPDLAGFYQYKQKEYNWKLDSNYFINLNSYKKYDPMQNLDLYSNKNIFLAGGSTDTVVPASYAESFKNKLNDKDNIVFNMYETAHVSTTKMHEDAYSFLETLKIK